MDIQSVHVFLCYDTLYRNCCRFIPWQHIKSLCHHMMSLIFILNNGTTLDYVTMTERPWQTRSS